VNAGISFFVGCFGLKLTQLAQKLIDSRGEILANRIIDRIAGTDEKKSPGP
jgi:carbon monoxide dehydrogenase subunit G